MKNLAFRAALVFFAWNAGAQEYAVGVAPFEGKNGLTVNEANAVTLVFNRELSVRENLRVVPQSSFEQGLRENGFVASEMQNNEKALRMGKALNLDWLVRGSVQKQGTRILITASPIDIRTPLAIRTVQVDLTTFDEMFEKVGILVDNVERIITGDGVLPILKSVFSDGASSVVAAAVPNAATVVARPTIPRTFAVSPRPVSSEPAAAETQAVVVAQAAAPPALAPQAVVGQEAAFPQENVIVLESAGPHEHDISQEPILTVETISPPASLAPGPAPGEEFAPGSPSLVISASITAPQTVTPTERPALSDVWVHVQGGKFIMGSPNSDAGRNRNEMQHTVTVSDFYINKYEVTQAEYEAVMGGNPSRFRNWSLPVEQVTWYEAIEYCNKLSLLEGLEPCYIGSGDNIIVNLKATGYRLPTEAEWEYAAIGGRYAIYLLYVYAGGNNVDLHGWHFNNSGGMTHIGGLKRPNALGLYDMSGNVYEWCWDWFGDYEAQDQTDPQGPVSGTSRVLRGGSWGSYIQYLRSTSRYSGIPSSRASSLGFRLVRGSL